MSQPGNDLASVLAALGNITNVIGPIKDQFEKSITQEKLDELDPVTKAKMNGYIAEINSKMTDLSKIPDMLKKAESGIADILNKTGL